MRFWMGIVAALAAGCSGGDGGTTDDGGTEGCTALQEGTWTMDGAAGGGMAMEATLTLDTDGCSFTFTDWNMSMGNLPAGGTVAGDQVTLSGDAYFETCTGTANADGSEVTGVCADDGAGFSMSLGGGMTM